ncbi:SUN domain-containing protein 2 isoform X2 [Cryptotermes secundus]|uniref:SUN domain-containing protein 2 isoform X2 n=1 Tax=Cryptotermes secundus TaxID=105785 RepID=UPI001454DF3B|nr:SUN domain-containing protein 2 isoform X2 [Cryptotermes secundus]
MVVILIAVTTYLCLEFTSVVWPLTSNKETEVYVLRKEVQFLRTVLRDRTNSLREQYERDLVDRLQRREMDLCTDTICDELSKVNDNSEQIVKEALQMYDSMMTGRMDFASESLGAYIVSTRDTKDYDSMQLGTEGRSVQKIIQGCVVPGECWAFKGTASVVIQLIGEVNVEAVSIEHASSALLSKEEINSAPKDFSVWGLNSLDVEGHYLGSFSYDINGSPLQTFTIQEPPETPFHLIELQIHSNYGNPTYTCLYRFRVHGSMTYFGQTQTQSQIESE